MGTFVLTVFSANAIGPLSADWIAQKVNWHWIYWVQLISGWFTHSYPPIPDRPRHSANVFFSSYGRIRLLPPLPLLLPRDPRRRHPPQTREEARQVDRPTSLCSRP
jgi:MFS family permease